MGTPFGSLSGALADIDDDDVAVLDLEDTVTRMVHASSVAQMVVRSGSGPAAPGQAEAAKVEVVRVAAPHSRARRLWRVAILSVRCVPWERPSARARATMAECARARDHGRSASPWRRGGWGT